MAADDGVAEQAGVSRRLATRADSGGGHAAAGAHKTKASSWITVALIVAASLIFAFALPLQSLPLAIVGAVVLLAGLVVGFTGKIMEDAH